MFHFSGKAKTNEVLCEPTLFVAAKFLCSINKNSSEMAKRVFFFFFFFGCVGSSFLCEGSLQLRQAEATPHRNARASPVAEHSLQTRRLSSCGSRSQLLRGMWDPPRPGLKPMSPAPAGRFSTTAPPGKPQKVILRN